MTKTLTPHVSVAAIEAETAKADPFQIALSNSKIVTIASPYEFRLSERAEIIELYQGVQEGKADDLVLLKRLMSKKDYEAYMAEDLSLAAHAQLMTMAMKHFEKGIKGDMGNSAASKA